MPYIKQEERKKFDEEIDYLISLIRPESGMIFNDGNVNYIVTRIIDGLYSNKDYAHYNRALGVLEAIKLELYRRKIAVYEERKLEDAGEVYSKWIFL